MHKCPNTISTAKKLMTGLDQIITFSCKAHDNFCPCPQETGNKTQSNSWLIESLIISQKNRSSLAKKSITKTEIHGPGFKIELMTGLDQIITFSREAHDDFYPCPQETGNKTHKAILG